MANIEIWGVKQNNLKNIDIQFPIGQLTVICGPSGSGKSSLAFETLFAEGQRRFIESMTNYARQFLNKAPKPDIEGIRNIPPAISIEQKNSVRSSRSTVGTTTEIIDYLRLLFEKVGQPHCPNHNIPIERETISDATDKVLRTFPDARGYLLVEIPSDGRLLDRKALLAQLLQDGFRRCFVPVPPKKAAKKSSGKQAKTSKKKISASQDISDPFGELVELNDLIEKGGVPEHHFYLVVDRMVFNADERGRLADSLSLAYETSLKFQTLHLVRRAIVVDTEGRSLNLSEEPCCRICGFQFPKLTSSFFSFNSPIGACSSCKGFGNVLEIDEKKVIPNPTLSISEGALVPFWMPSAASDKKRLLQYCRANAIDLDTPWEALPLEQRKKIWNGDKSFFGVKGLFEYLDQIKYKMHVRVFISRFRSPSVCKSCGGSRLRSEAQHVLINKKNMNQIADLTIDKSLAFFESLKLSREQTEISAEILRQIRARLSFLVRVGVHYLTLSRETRTLSGGEYQRLMLANQLGMGLSQTLYVLDEPTVGLHPRDNDRLISILKDLRDLGNTLVVVEHDHDVILNSEHVVEMGPGSGSLGGQVIYSGPTEDFFEFKDSVTVPFLRPKQSVVTLRTVRPVDSENYRYKIELTGCKGHNLRDIDVVFPLNRIVAVTGVSGSGKSTLVTKTLYPALARALNIEFLPHQPFDQITGVENIKNVVLIDQASIGKSARSSPITYLKSFDLIRTIMASTPDARLAGFTAGDFSLNVDGGRCPVCKGTGYEEIDMQFMDNVIIPCDVCDGKRYRPELLEVKFKNKNIHEILQMTVTEAMNFFVAHPSLRKSLSVLKEVGLDYIQIGQSASSLSGGESQRLKLARELSTVSQKSTLYILDEPTTGLHFREVELLMKTLQRLIDAGGSVIVVEHNMDVIRDCDYVIDMGPDAGERGGMVVSQGAPQDIMDDPKSLTGVYLRRYLNQMMVK
ncbi:MAG TPA: excinuclease ABC subunit UvrA [Pseudobdellovibrionaceae bacterium]|nr:excinuclease ABC subunit UvrA [Pseudobdellovibrionaceae bacterium]